MLADRLHRTRTDTDGHDPSLFVPVRLSGSPIARDLGHVHTYPEFFFSANIFLRIRKFSRPHAAYSNGLVSDCIRK